MEKHTKDAAIAHALAEYPNESCGLVVVIEGVEEYRPCRNLAQSKSDHFILDPVDYAAAEDAGAIIGVVHSHPDAHQRPSQGDLVGCEESGLKWYILAVHGDPLDDSVKFVGDAEFEPNGFEAPLIGRDFHHGKQDCYALVRDYYKRELGIDLKNYERSDNWWERGENLYLSQLDEAGFYEVDVRDIRVGDMIIMQIKSPEPNHAGVYVGDGKFIHHLYNRLSSTDVYGGYWREVTRLVVRHKESK